MDIKERIKEKGIKIVGILLGICALLLFESRGAGDRKGDYLVQHHDPCIGRKGKYFCMSVPSGEEQ